MKKMMIALVFVLVMTLSACKEEPTDNNNQTDNDNHLTTPTVTFVIKDYGELTVELYPNIAPETVNSFLTYVVNGDYEGSTFHRVIEHFMIQGGKVDQTLCSIYGEFSSNGFDNDLLHERGVLSLARTNVMNSGTSQFFIMHADYPSLDGAYAAFGKLISGYSILDRIATTNTGTNDQPVNSVVIESVSYDLDGFVLQEINCKN